MSWDAKNVALLTLGRRQIAHRLGCSRNAVCGRLTRLGLKRVHKPPTAKTQDNVGLEAKAGVVGRLCPPGGKEGVPEDSWDTTQEI